MLATMWILGCALAGIIAATLYRGLLGICIWASRRAGDRRFDGDGVEIL